jgi:hypothetical protein
MKKTLLLISGCVSVCILTAQIINVPDDYPTIQAAVLASHNGDTVLVQPGIYNENVSIEGFCITLASRYLVTQDTSFISQTIIDGNQAGRGIKIWMVDSLHLSGLTVTGGSSDFWGGGIACSESSNVLIEHIKISGNKSAFYGGGISVMQCEDLICRNIEIDSNVACDVLNNWDMGGGIYCEDSSPYFEDFIISGNTADAMFYGQGGGIYCLNASPVFKNGYIINNTAYNGGAVYCYNSSPVFENVNISNNTSGSGAIYCDDGSNPVFRNVIFNENNINPPNVGLCSVIHCGISGSNFPFIINSIITGNAQGFWGIGTVHLIYTESTSSLVSLTNTIVYFNGEEETSYLYDVSINFSDIQDYNYIWPGEGNINQDPQFLATGEHPFQPGPGSPCIDAGTPDTSGLNLPMWDLMGNYRFWDGDLDGDTIVDMGAYEFGSVGVKIPEFNIHPPAGGSTFNISCYPNPIAEIVHIEFEIENPTLLSIQVFNVIGERMAVLSDGIMSDGKHQIIWNAASLPAGLYFFKMQIRQEVVMKKIVKL